MSLFGQMEVAYYQLTPLGMQRAQNPMQTRGLDMSTINLLRQFVKAGGSLEWDEMKFTGGYDSPTVLSVALRRLVDLGYVAPVQIQPQEVA